MKFKNFLLDRIFRFSYIFSRIKLKLGISIGLVRTLTIMPYRGFGNDQEVYFVGRVLKKRGIGLSSLEDSRLKNFIKMYKRFMTWEIPGIRIKAEYGEEIQSQLTDQEGYFEFHLKSPKFNPPPDNWLQVKLELLEQVVKHHDPVKAINQIRIPSGEVDFGIISDIDDTIVPTGATRIFEMFKTTFFGNAHSRTPFPGVSAFYQALEKGGDGLRFNPFFYVSSSPWNLYDFLEEMMDVHNIPKGPLMLRDLGLSRKHLLSGSHQEHKLVQVEKIFSLVRNIPFILVGDSGQHDPEIYLQVIRDFPGRVKMIYIRDVDPSRRKSVQQIARQIRELGVEMLLVKNTLEAANHALSKGWIRKEDLGPIDRSKQQQEEN
jgi:phosphatidate phosphatase APP1